MKQILTCLEAVKELILTMLEAYVSLNGMKFD